MTEIIESFEAVKTRTTKTSEPALPDLLDARRVRQEREREFDRSHLGKNEKVKYLESVAEELKLRGNAQRHQVYEIGKLLLDAKSFLPHGAFDEWVRENTPFSKSTALNCMRVYKCCLGHPELVSYFSNSAVYVLCAPRFPKNLREALFENAEGLYDISQKQLLEVALKWKNGELTLESPEVQKLMKSHRQRSIFKRYEVEVRSMITVLKGKLKKMEYFGNQLSVQPLLKEDNPGEDHRYEEIEGVVYKCTVELEALLGTLRSSE